MTKNRRCPNLTEADKDRIAEQVLELVRGLVTAARPLLLDADPTGCGHVPDEMRRYVYERSGKA